MSKLRIIISLIIVLRSVNKFCFGTSDFFGEPKFSAQIENVTIPVGREALLTCKVHDLMSYKVAWLRVDTQTILTIQNQVITKNHRINIAHTEHRMWQLKIREVRELDRGWYMCQINTDPMKSQVGYLDVVVPPDIIDKETSHDIVVEENQNITLICKASGLPKPIITWRREKERAIINNWHDTMNQSFTEDKVIYTIEGENLTLINVQRHNMGAYLCIASNGVPPSISKRVLLVVNFPPSIWSSTELIHAYIGQKITLECISESYPASTNYWLKGKEFIQGGTYESVTLENVFRIVMRLIIRPLKPRDFGDYKCIARNSLGETTRIITIKLKSRREDIFITPGTIITGNNLAIFQNEIISGAEYFSNKILNKVLITILLILKKTIS